MAERKKIIAIAAGIFVFVSAIMVVAAFKLHNFGYNGFDLAIYNQTFWNTVHGSFFANSMNPPSYLGDHAEWPILALAPVYALIPHPLTLIFLQAAAIGLGAFIVFRAAKIIFPGRNADLFFALLWLANPFAWNLALFEFHIIAFAVPLILLAALFFLERRWLPYFLSLLAVALVREDLFLTVLGFSLLTLADILRHREPLRGAAISEPRFPRLPGSAWLTALSLARNKVFKWSVLPALCALAIFFLDQAVIGRFNPDGAYKYSIYYRWLGDTPWEMFAYILNHPLRVLAHVLDADALSAAAALLIPSLFLPVFAPRFLLLAAGAAAEFALSQTGADMVIVKTQYAAPFIAPLFLAAMEGYAFMEKKGWPWKILPRPLFPAALAIACACAWFGYGPGTGISSSFSADARELALRNAVSMIPPHASAISTFDALSSLSSRKDVFPLGYVFLGQKQFGTSPYELPFYPEYLLIDRQDFIYFAGTYRNVEWSSGHYAEGDERLRRLISAGGYGVVFDEEGVMLLKRGESNGKKPLTVLPSMPITANAAETDIGPIRFLGWEDKEGGRMLYFSIQAAIEGDPVAIVNGNIVLLGNGLYPVSSWRQKEVFAVRTEKTSFPLTVEITDLKGGLYVNGDGSLTLRSEKSASRGKATIPR